MPSRDQHLDNLKGWAIVLVVFGHLIERQAGHNELSRWIYLGIYLFHMPAFVFLAGVTTRGAAESGYGEKTVVRVLAPLMIFTILYEGSYRLAKGQWSDFLLGFKPYWILWFLLSLLCWRALLPWILRVPGGSRWGWLVAFVLALVAGGLDWIGYGFGLSRTIYFFPFFLLGHGLQDSVRRLLAGPQWLAVAAGVGCALALASLGDRITPAWLHGSNGYAALGIADGVGALARAGLFLLSALAVWAFLRLVPARPGWITRVGARSLSVFVWHGLLIRWLIPERLGLDDGWPAVIGSSVVAIALAVMLSSDRVWWFTQRVLLALAGALLVNGARVLRGLRP